MKLNRIEFMLMNNPLRAVIQEYYEARILRSLSSTMNADRALEIGCGNGNGTKVIKKLFSPKSIVAIDLDERMIEIAQRRNKDGSVGYKVMDASNLEFPDDHFDAIFDFGIIHHIPNWRRCIKEIYRVLKPGGEVILEDLSRESFAMGMGKLWRKILDHPYRDMYTALQFTEYLKESGFSIGNYGQYNPLRLIRHFSLNAYKK